MTLPAPSDGNAAITIASTRAPRFDSLRWRLPVFFGVLVLLMLGSFVWATSRTVEGALVQAGHERARTGAEQVAGMIERPIATRMKESARFQTDSTLRRALRDPTPPALAAARRVLVTSSTPSLRRAELWDAGGSLVLEIVSAPPDTAVGLHAYPLLPRPTSAEVSEIRAAGKFNFFTIVTEIRDDSARGGAPLGHLRRFGRVTSTAGSPIKRLLGDSAIVKIGSASGGAWTDFYEVVDAPPALEGPPEAGEYRSASGRRWVGATDPIEGSQWMAWVGFPRTMIVAPARPFMQRMLLLALLFVMAGIALALLLGVRLTQPLHALAVAAERIAAGDYTHRVGTGRRDEIGRLGDAFNSMTDRIEHASTALRKSHEQTYFALAAAGIGVWETNLATGRMLCSKSMHLVHHLPGGRLPETREEFVNLLYADDRESVRKILQGDTPGHDDFDIEYRASGPGGSMHWMEGKGRLVRDSSGKPASVLGVSIDVTDRARLEAQFRQAQRMEAIGQLAGGVAHDFNNLLTAIIGHGELLLSEVQDGPAQTDVKEILKAAEMAAKLTSQLLAFSRHQVLQLEVVDVNAVIRDTEKLLARLIGERISLVTNLATGLDPIKVDAAQLQQVLVNLAVNSRDAMSQGGTLSISSANVDLDDEYAAEHAGVEPGRHVVISVADTGVGMDAATQARLFEPFFTTKEMGKGTGLGMATVYGIVKQSGGHIYVYSELGRGATFKIYFPASSESVAAPKKRPAAAPNHATGKELILVVDDNEAVRVVAQMILERAGYRVLGATSGQEALELLARTQPRPVLMVSDVILPGMTGPELYREVAAKYPEIRAIFTSGYSPEAIASHATLEPGVLFIEKPYTPSQLASKVREVLGRTS